MNLSQSSMAILAVVIVTISVWWIGQTLKEGKKAVEESKNEKISSF